MTELSSQFMRIHYFFHLFVYLGEQGCHGVCTEVRGQVVVVGSFLLTCRLGSK